MTKTVPPTTEYRRIDANITILRLVLVAVAIGLLVLLGFLVSSEGEDTFTEGVNRGRIEIITGQVICRQIPLQGTEIQLECKTREEIEDLLRFIQPQGNIK